MAEFCTNRAVKFKHPPDIDVEEIYKTLKFGEEINIEEICEGCSLVGLKNDGSRKIKSAHFIAGKIVWRTYNINNSISSWDS